MLKPDEKPKVQIEIPKVVVKTIDTMTEEDFRTAGAAQMRAWKNDDIELTVGNDLKKCLSRLNLVKLLDDKYANHVFIPVYNKATKQHIRICIDCGYLYINGVFCSKNEVEWIE